MSCLWRRYIVHLKCMSGTCQGQVPRCQPSVSGISGECCGRQYQRLHWNQRELRHNIFQHLQHGGGHFSLLGELSLYYGVSGTLTGTFQKHVIRNSRVKARLFKVLTIGNLKEKQCIYHPAKPTWKLFLKLSLSLVKTVWPTAALTAPQASGDAADSWLWGQWWLRGGVSWCGLNE